MPRRLKKLTKAPSQDFLRAYNELVRVVDLLRKMSGSGVVRVSWVNGVPLIRGTRQKGGLIGKADEDIDARSDNTPGSGTVSLWEFDSDDELFDTEQDETAYNLSSNAVTAGQFLQLKRHESGRLLIDFEDCTE